MIYKNTGDVFEYEGKIYIVGEEVYAISSAYRSLLGTITEIRTGNDRVTVNEEPEIFCDFHPPILKQDREDIESMCGKLDKLCLDGIIMAPSMLVPIREGHCDGKENFGKIYLLQEDWSYDGDGQEVNSMAFTNMESALMFLRYRLYQEAEDGSISSYQNNEAMQVDEGNDWYEIYLEGFYNDDHYNIRIVELSLAMSESYLKSLTEKVIAIERRENLIEQIEQWEETGEMTDAQYSAVINDETLSERIGKKLADDEFYWDSYWQAVSEVASDLIAKHTKME